jgi:hypothetical protein
MTDQQPFNPAYPPPPMASAPASGNTAAKFLLVGGGAGAVLGALLPWIDSVLGFSVNGTNEEFNGRWTLFLGLVALGLSVRLFMGKPLGVAGGVAAIVVGVLAGALSISDFSDIQSMVSDSDGFASVGSGVWLTIISSIAIAAGGGVALKSSPGV